VRNYPCIQVSQSRDHTQDQEGSQDCESGVCNMDWGRVPRSQNRRLLRAGS